MRWFSNMKVGVKLMGGFLIVSLIAAIIGLIGLRSVAELDTLMGTMYDRDIVGLNLASDANIQMLSAERAIRNAALNDRPSVRQEHLESMARFMTNARQQLDQLGPSFSTDEGRALLKEAQDTFATYEQALGTLGGMLSQNTSGGTSRITDFMTEQVRPLSNKVDELLHTLVERKLTDSNALNVYANEVYKNVQVLMISLTAVGVILAIFIGLIIARVITRQLGGEPLEVAGIAYSIAEGNLNTKIDAARAPKGSVVDAMSIMQSSLRKVVAGVRSSSDSIATGSSQIAIGNADLSQRTEEQAANITQTAAAMEQLSSTVKSNAEVARQAAQLSSSTSVAAVKGGEVVNDVVTTMVDINESSRKIVEIIGVIDGIAFQTNILALNAAVEAARAGEQGRGFAVVASEVRSLAQRSASAARDIKKLIDDSVSKVSVGTEMVNAAGESMQGIVTQVKQVTDLINDISAATTEQTTGLAQINDAVVQLSDVTQQNAALVEESATAAESLSEQAQHLVDAVRVFQIGNEQDRLAPAAAELRTLPPQRQLPPREQAPSKQPAALSTTNKSALLKPAPRLATSSASTSATDDWEEF